MIPNFYCVYILQSISNPKSTYIGSTPDIKKRLRQHNGEIKGGAYKTKKKRPWRVILIIHDFTSKISALQFEHSLQHSYQTRLIDNKISKKGSNSLHQIFANIKQLLNSFIQLKIIIFDEEIKQIWDKNKYKIDQMEEPNIINFDQFEIDEIELLNIPNERKCIICDLLIESEIFGICKQDHLFHLSCLAKQSNTLIPIEVECKCGEIINWKDMIKQSLYTIHHEQLHRDKNQNNGTSQSES